LAKGGEVKHYASGGYEEPDLYSPEGVLISGGSSRMEPEKPEWEKEWERKYAKKKPTKTNLPPKDVNPPSNVPANQPGLTVEEMMRGSTRAGTWDALNNDQTTGRALPQEPEPPKSRIDAYVERMLANEGNAEKQRSDDINMALLTAGLGMLGGTSQHAGVNIGQGALAGVQNLSESKKMRAAQQAALDKNMLYATRYQGVEDLNKQNAAYNRAMKQQQYELDVKKYGTEQQKIAINQYETHINNAMKLLKDNPNMIDPAVRQAEEAKIINSQAARNLYRRAYGEDPAGEVKSNIIKFDARGKQIAG
jgi:hypothetical protein